MLISFIRTIILYFLIVIALRIMGQRQVGQLEPSELVVTMMISDLAAIPVGHVSIPLMRGIVPVVTLILLEAIVSFANLKSRTIRKLISGVPVVVIENGVVIEKELKRLRLNIDDLMEELRINNYSNITEIQYAIFETNGSLSIISKPEYKPVTLQDMGRMQKYCGLPFLFVCDGIINETALKIYRKNKAWLTRRLAKMNLDVKSVLLAGVDESGKFYAQKKE